ncbi:hypothetical protein PHISCL_00944 [Aspergillus sclerotialis]|uniref:Arrestin-like N-terminal domain-containing protein n=1 Tax=Aspergillus sclerotialis TaxID=2070753 RepID=A0A3A2ZWK1_9EURO|nr:hypothetical protein PHISCL_00944 [Aspergillus sclerotialis]
MPRTYKSGSANLHIDLAAPPKWSYAAGAEIIGNVTRHSPVVSPEASVTLRLNGRVKTKITVSRGQNGKDVYRGRWNLFQPRSVLLYKGPLHLGQDGSDPLLWPFSINLPTGPDLSVLTGHFKGESFLPLNEDHVTNSPLPGTAFVINDSIGSRTSHGFVEYFLTATLQYNRAGSLETDAATLPITVRHPPGPIPATVIYRTKPWTTDEKIHSQRLVPGMESAELSFKQKTQKFFHSSKVPGLHFTVEIGSPRVIQFDNPEPFPFTVRLVPQRKTTSPAIRDVVYQFRLNWVKMKIKSSNTVIAPGNWIDSVHRHETEEKSSFNLEQAFSRLECPVMIPCSEGEKNKVNIGSMLQLVLHSNGLNAWLTSGGRPLPLVANFAPDYTTYNIRHRNLTVEWELSLSLVEETISVKAKLPVQILPAF